MKQNVDVDKIVIKDNETGEQEEKQPEEGLESR